ncbi:MAG TPA: geranylgeranyl reductase family protein [Actinomycetota bacterium]|nr:geranylgeranyl reductase family protein [Actinomycetota bacterium]
MGDNRLSSPRNAHIETDVLVVGAGPGGSTAAYHLARHGIDVLLVEKAAFPRDKVCGDGLTPRAVVQLERMGIDTRDPGFERHEGLRIYSRRVRLELPWPELEDFPSYGLVMPRARFDQMLARRAEGAGARLLERTEAVAPVVSEGWVTGARLRREDGEPPLEVRSRFVIAADGASSRFAAQVGVRRDASKPLGIAARRYFRIDRHPGPWLEVWMDLWDGDRIMPGYGWLFPLPDGSVNLGAGLLNTFKNFKDVSAQRVFDAFWRMLPPDWNVSEDTAEGRVLSGPLPMGLSRTPTSVPGLLLVGDAAGIVNPFNGEGIAYAMESAELAAELVLEALVRDRPGLAHLYPTLLRDRYEGYYRVGTQFVRAIGHPPVMRALTDHALPREWLMRFMLRVMGNLTDGRKGDAQDRLMDRIVRLARAS